MNCRHRESPISLRRLQIPARSLPLSSTRLANRIAIIKTSSQEKKIFPPKSSPPVPLPTLAPTPVNYPRPAQTTAFARSRLACRLNQLTLRFPVVLWFLSHLRRDSAVALEGMRLHAEVLDKEEQEQEQEQEQGAVMATASLSPPLNGSLVAAPRVVVGYALTKKKVKSFLQPKLLLLARKNGISFVSIDESLPLSEQGPFDIILHKITSKEWQQVLEDYHEEHPEVTVLDPPNAIEHLNNRQSMLEEVADLNLSNFYGEVCTPRQLVITKDPSSIPTAVAMAGLTLPLVAKPLVVDGTSKGHELYLAYDEASLSMLDPPLVLQEFINHGGILFKVYIVGETIQVARRFSLPDVNTYDLLNNIGVYRLPRVSCAAASADDADLDPLIAELPPRPLLEKLGRELRGRLGLRLFNIDMIRELGTKDRYYIIDINYFPGFGKMPGYEHIFTDFLLNLAQSKYKRYFSGT